MCYWVYIIYIQGKITHSAVWLLHTLAAHTVTRPVPLPIVYIKLVPLIIVYIKLVPLLIVQITLTVCHYWFSVQDVRFTITGGLYNIRATTGCLHKTHDTTCCLYKTCAIPGGPYNIWTFGCLYKTCATNGRPYKTHQSFIQDLCHYWSSIQDPLVVSTRPVSLLIVHTRPTSCLYETCATIGRPYKTQLVVYTRPVPLLVVHTRPTSRLYKTRATTGRMCKTHAVY